MTQLEPGTKLEAVVGEFVDEVLRSDPAQDTVRAQMTRTRTVTRLDAVQQLVSVIDTELLAGTAISRSAPG